MTNPLNASFSIRLFGNIINTVADNLFNDMLIHTGFLCRGDELNTTIMRTMPGGTRPKAFTTNALPFLCVLAGDLTIPQDDSLVMDAEKSHDKTLLYQKNKQRVSPRVDFKSIRSDD